MARGPRRHLKRLFAPKDWFLSKLNGVFAPRPRAGPHKLRECIPLLVLLRNRLKYALTAREANMILRQKLVKVDNRVRTDSKYPAGFMDVIDLPRTGERFRLMYDVKGRFTLVKIGEAEAGLKMCRVNNVYTSTHRIPMITTHDGRRIRYPDPLIRRGDSVLVDLKEGKITDFIKLKVGQVAMITGGNNRGRLGQISSIERFPGVFDIITLKDREGNEMATRDHNVFVIGNNFESVPISLPKFEGVRRNPVVDREEKLAANEARKRAVKGRH